MLFDMPKNVVCWLARVLMFVLSVLCTLSTATLHALCNKVQTLT